MLEDHDFSVYEGKSHREIYAVLESHIDRIEIADILVDIGLLEHNPFLWTSVTYNNGNFAAVAPNGSIITSKDGVTWK